MLARINRSINRSFSRRLVFFFVPYIIVLLVVVTLLSFNSFYSTLKQEKENSTRILVTQISDKFDFYFKDIKTLMAYISVNKDVSQALKRYGSLSIQERYDLNNRIAAYTSNINIFKNHINDIIIIGNNGYIANLPSYYRLSSSADLAHSAWLQGYHASESSRFYFTPLHRVDYYTVNTSSSWVVSSILPIIDQGKPIGYLQGDIDYKTMDKLLDTVYKQSDIRITMVAPNGQIAFDRDTQRISAPLDPELLGRIQGSEGSFVSWGDADSSLIVYRKSDVTGWYLVASIPYSALLTPGYSIATTILLILLPISLVCALVIFVLISRQFKKPLSQLVRRMESVHAANYRPAPIDYGVGEIADLGRTFEAMLAQINELIEQVYLAEIKKKDAEFELLRKQISPHFMYNSLQLIKAEAIFAKNKQISQIVTSLANLLRYALDNQTAHVQVAEEIRYIQDYLEIYRRRYISKFAFAIDVDPAMLQRSIQKLTLQPIVENCIKHGFEQLKSGGMIQISGRIDRDDLIFEVRDNGKGISPACVAQLRQQLAATDRSSASGIGLSNVHQRIGMECGAGYGITDISSSEGEFTQIVLKSRG